MRNELHVNAKCSYGYGKTNLQSRFDMTKTGKVDSSSSNADLVLILFTKTKKVLGAPPTSKYPYFTSLLERGRVQTDPQPTHDIFEDFGGAVRGTFKDASTSFEKTKQALGGCCQTWQSLAVICWKHSVWTRSRPNLHFENTLLLCEYYYE